LAEHVTEQALFYDVELKPRLDAAVAGRGHVFFVDAAHFVFGTFLCCLWSFTRIFVRAAAGRQRFNVLGAWNAVTRELVSVTNTTVVNTETMCELLRKIAALGLTGPITLVLDNARYQRNAAVQALATQLEITLAVPAVVLAEPEPHRTALEVHQAPGRLRTLPSRIPRVSSRHPRNDRRPRNPPRRTPEIPHDAQLSAI